MGSAFYCVDIVDVGINLFPIAIVVLEGYVDRYDLVRIYADRVRDKRLGIGIKVIDELAQALVGVEHLGAVHLPACRLGLPCRRILGHLIHELPLVGKHYSDALVEEGELAKACRQSVIFVNRGLGKDFSIGMEGDGGAGIVALPCHLDRSQRLALGIVLYEYLSLPVDFCSKAIRKRIHAGHAHAVQTAGNLVVGFAELATGMEHCEHDFEGTAVLLFVHARRDASAVVLD